MVESGGEEERKLEVGQWTTHIIPYTLRLTSLGLEIDLTSLYLFTFSFDFYCNIVLGPGATGDCIFILKIW